MPVLSIVIPAYNEGPTIHFILDKVLAVQLPGGWTKEVIIVNDCSKDDTEAAIQAWAAGPSRPSLSATMRTRSTKARARPCIQVSLRPRAIT